MSGILRIELKRPEKRNALDRDTVRRLRATLEEAAMEPKGRVILLTAQGRDFCSGADLSELKRIRHASVLENLEDARELGELFVAMRQHPLPIIAAVRGRALAGGCGLATACDLIVASDIAQFGYPETRIGFVPAMVMAILRRTVPEKVAFDMLTTGRILTAREAFEVGLVSRIVADVDLEGAAEELAGDLASRSASAVQLTKRLLYQMDGMSYANAIEAGAQVNAIARLTPDCQEGIDRFFKKGI
ncbi:MAG: enoyl-CoA hydratase/isomerase family protein [Bryobacterales bacterium]|nr:enoyl-CoA hydratase/isomerase family protein [Bryobacterales bacterium]